jgi:RNA polymerase sigma-70 factor (ECF subfamily)
MANLPTTRPSLLLRIRDPQDAAAWRDFVRIYAPVVYSYGRRRGLQDADAADLTQEVLRAVAAAAGRLEYDPQRGSFAGWLFTLAHHQLHDLQARRRRQSVGTGDTKVRVLLEQQPAREDDRAVWQGEYERRLFNWAAQRVRGSFHESTWQAFWSTAVEGQSVKEAAARLGLTAAAVYLARSRVMARLREQIEQVEEGFEDTDEPSA